jgi:tRNA 2-thiouridine synthesizing protein E
MSVSVDPEGFLINLSDWNEEVANELAQAQEIELTDAHWEILQLARQFFTEFDHSPSQRPLGRYIKINLGADKAKSIYLMKLFGSSPAKMVSLLAGLPKPKNCL